MGVLTVRAPDSQQAMEEVLRRLGPDAYILSTAQRDGQIEIRAARELPPVPGTPRTFGELLEERRAETARPALVAERGWVPPAPRPLSPGSGTLADTLLPATPPRLPARLVVVGPPGAGKTLLALRFAALMIEERPGAEPVILAPRVGHEGPDARLRHWARLLDLPVERPRLADLDAFLAPEPDPLRPEIVDLSCLPDASPERIEAMMEAGAEVVLALPAGLAPRLALRLAAAPAGVTLCLTRTDLWTPEEAELAALARSGLRLGWESGGTGVVDALRRMDRDRLAAWAAGWARGSDEREDRA
ncbi:hypothetical protein [Rhodobacter sp. CZR27]|uniref:hypothetical protein n=1 Tax=Rhodobacter sp. CZR27 TaxID=2033869 RepID=UPI000BBEF3EA|nr:hypothetical protein [Rhodobacter sp. CZR27]